MEEIDQLLKERHFSLAERKLKYIKDKSEIQRFHTYDGRNILHTALWKNAPLSIISYLIHSGMDVNEENKVQGTTPLIYAVAGNVCSETISYLLSIGAEVNKASFSDGWTCLHAASFYGANSELLSLFLKHGGDLNRKNKDGFTPLHYANLKAKSDPSWASTAIHLFSTVLSTSAHHYQHHLSLKQHHARSSVGSSSHISTPPTTSEAVVAPNEILTAFDNTSLSLQDQRQYAILLTQAGYNTTSLLEKLTPERLEKVGITKEIHVETIMEEIVMVLRQNKKVLSAKFSSLSKSYLLFFSYCKSETIAEVSTLYEKSLIRFPNSKIFRDVESQFELDHLINIVRESSSVVVVLSPNYVKHPYCLLELVSAIRTGARIFTIKIIRDGMKIFDFDQVSEDIRTGEVANYLSDREWEFLSSDCQVYYDEVVAALKRLTNVKAFDYSSNFALEVQAAMIKVILDTINEDEQGE